MRNIGALDDMELEEGDSQLLRLITGYLCHQMMSLGEDEIKLVFDFHARLVQRHIKHTSRVMNIWGFKQVHRLIYLTNWHRWNVKAYRVEGAGSQECNGIYRVSPDDAARPPQTPYHNPGATLASSAVIPQSREPPAYFRDNGGGRALSRRNDGEYEGVRWYIRSENAAHQSEGPAADLYFYQPYCRSLSHTDIHTPHPSRRCMLEEGLDPPPTVTPLSCEGYLCPPGQEHETLEWKLAEWLVANDVVNEIFGDKICREGVSGSEDIIFFADTMGDTLTTERLDFIWSRGVQQEPMLQHEVNTMLVALTSTMKEELTLHLLGRMQQGLDGTVAWGGHGEVVGFLECLDQRDFHNRVTRCDATSRAA
ncbi:unnamed protein product [Ectocarpus fasciculatus]